MQQSLVTVGEMARSVDVLLEAGSPAFNDWIINAAFVIESASHAIEVFT